MGPGGGKVMNSLVSQWTQVCRNIAMPGHETVLYDVNPHSGVVRRWPLAPARLRSALGSFSSWSWGRLQMLHLESPNSAQGGLAFPGRGWGGDGGGGGGRYLDGIFWRKGRIFGWQRFNHQCLRSLCRMDWTCSVRQDLCAGVITLQIRARAYKT